MKNKLGLYVHIPFCSKKCDYCDFVSYSMNEEAQRKYLDALKAEIDMRKYDFIDDEVDTLYIGGGTPSFVFKGFIKELCEKLYSSFHFVSDAEITIEVNPESFTQEKFLEYLSAGFNRISVGVQCIDSEVLSEVGRFQTISSVKRTFDILRNSKFLNVSADIMIGLPDQTPESIFKTVQFLLSNHVKHVSVYSLQLENRTALYDKVKRGKITLPKDHTVLKVYNQINDNLKLAGFTRYEVSNFAIPGFESKHNIKYWTDMNYLGLGAAAHSYIDHYRLANTKRLDTYIDNINAGKLPLDIKEYVPLKTRRTERIMLGLRTAKGIDLEKFHAEFNEDLMLTKRAEISKLIKLGMLAVDNGYLKLTDEYYYVSNNIIKELI